MPVALINKSKYALSLTGQSTIEGPEGEKVPHAIQVLVPTGAAGRIEVSDADWSVLEKNAGVKNWQRIGHLVVVKGKADAKPDTSPLADLSAKGAIELIEVADDAAELHDMLAAEDRKTVREAIERRLAALAN